MKHCRIAALVAAIVAAGVVAAATPPPAATQEPSASLSPDKIYSRAEETLRRNPDPRYMTYRMHEVFVHRRKRFEYDYRIWYRNDGKGLMQNEVPDRRGRRETFFQYPFPLAPDINILLYATPAPVSTPPPPLQSPAPLASGASPPPIIGVQPVVSNRFYVITLAGLEDDGGRQVYHLNLRPLSDERSHPLKDVWIDAESFQVRRAHVRANGTLGPLTGTLEGTAVFGPIGAIWVMTHMVADGEGRVGFISDSGHYEYSFSDFDFPMTIPDWYFDPREFSRKRH